MQDDFFHDLFGNGMVRIALVGTLAILALFLLAEAASVAENLGRPTAPASDTITVSGDGTAVLPPDIAHITFSVENTAKAVADAQAATTKQANTVLAWVATQGIAQKDVKTLSYTITPQYAYPQPCPAGLLCPISSPTITGYQVAETVQLTVRNLDSVGAVLGGLGSEGVQNVSGPDFALADPNAGPDAARADAITNAKAQAETIASELGVELGRIVNFSESSGGMPYPVMYAAAVGKGAAAAPSVPAGENTYTASVSITYELR